MTNHGIHGNLLEVTVVSCNNLKDTEWFSRQDPYVCVEYGNGKSRTCVCTDGGKNPKFQEKFLYSLIEGIQELNILVWNSNNILNDYFIGSGKVQLDKVLSDGYDDFSWPLLTKTGRHAGEVRLIMHYSKANNTANSFVASAPPSGVSSTPHASMYYAPPPTSSIPHYQPPTSQPPYPPSPIGAYTPYSSYAPNLAVFPPPPYPPPPQETPYPPQPYPHYSVYPPQPYGSHHPHGSQYPGGVHPPY